MDAPDFDRPEYGSDVSLSDMVLIAALGFILLFLAALLMVRPPGAEANTKLKAEFVLTMTWPDGALDDIDMWVQLPNGRKVWYGNKDVEYATLDRDDRGALGDTYDGDKGERQLTLINREMATIRAIVPGRYIVAAHVFTDRPIYTEGKTWEGAPKLPYEATLEMSKLNPRAVDILRAKVALTEKAQEVVFAAFEVDHNGEVRNIELNPSQYKIVDLVPSFAGEHGP